MILFLTTYSGPVADNAYRLKGLYQGQYRLDGNVVLKNNENKLTGDEILQNIDSLLSRISSVKYNPVIPDEPTIKE
jgi:lipopolysaccharide export system protein LptA